MNNSDPRGTTKAFETKVASLIEATRHLDIPQILVLRRMTVADPESRRWASDKQLNVVFNVILTKAIERNGINWFRSARGRNFDTVLPPAGDGRDEDLRVLSDLANQMLGPASEATAAQADFEKLVARGPSAPPPRIPRAQPPIKEPPPLFAAQLGPDAKFTAKQVQRNALGEQLMEQEERPFVDFQTLFDDTICDYCEKILSLLRITAPSQGLRVPFIVAPEFGHVYQELLRKYVLPPMRNSRQLQALSTSYNWAEVGGERLLEIIQGGEVNNPVLHNWDARWSSFRPARVAKGKKPPPLKAEDNPWPFLREEAVRGGYVPPEDKDLQLLQDLIRFEADSLAKCWREVNQLYEQEFSPNARQEQAREGALRDGLMKWAARLPDHLGEFEAMKIYFEMPRCDGDWLRRLLNNFGRTEQDRYRNAPYLCEFVQQLLD